MEKINFQDLPSTNTPINASNLNQMQDNIEDSLTYKNDILFAWDDVETDGTYTLANGKKFSDYNLIEFVTARTSIIKSYSSLISSEGKIFQLIYYESPSSGKTEIIIQIEYISDTQFKCNMSAYTGDGGGFGNNPYQIEIRGII